MKTKVIFQFLAKINKLIFPSFAKKGLDLKKVNKKSMLESKKNDISAL